MKPDGNAKTKTSGAGRLAAEEKRPDAGDADRSISAHSYDASFRRIKILVSVILFILVGATFSNSLFNDFTSYDDVAYVTGNNRVQMGLTWDGIAWAFRTTTASNWHPLAWLSHMLDCEMFGLRPWGHHLTSLLLHATNTVLLFLLLSRMTGTLLRSLVVALLFGLHPLRVESVAWVAERKDVLSTLFWMLTLLAYVRYVGILKAPASKPKAMYALALLFFVLGLLSKPMVVTLPFALLLLDFWPLERWKSNSVKRLVVEKFRSLSPPQPQVRLHF